MTRSVYVKTKLYIGGVETPLVSADITSGDSIMESAVINIPTTEYSRNFIRGLKVEVFSQHTYNDQEKGEWLLEFTGEITGRNYSRTARSVGSSYVCMGHGNLWQRIQEYIYNLIPDTLDDMPVPINDIGTHEATGVPLTGYFETLINDCKDNIKIAIESLLTRSTGSLYSSDGAEDSKNLKEHKPKYDGPPYYVKSLKEFKLGKRIYVSESTKLKEHTDLTLFINSFVSRILPSVNGIHTIMDIAMQLMGHFFYRFGSVAQATYHNETITNYFAKLRGEITIPPKCNLVFPDQVVDLNFNEDFMATPTRVIAKYQDYLGVVTGSGSNFFSHFGVGPRELENGSYEEFLFKGDKVHNLSTYEETYGTNIKQIGVDPILMSSSTKSKQTIMNQEFYKKFFQARTFSAEFDPSVNIVPGAPVVVLDNYLSRNHIVAYCTSIRRVFHASGQEQVIATLTHPKFYDEIVNIFNSVVDYLTPSDLDEIYLRVGSEKMSGDISELSAEILKISELYHNSKEIPEEYRTRKRCTQAEYGKVGVGEIAKAMKHNEFQGSTDPLKPGEAVVPMSGGASIVKLHNKQLELIGLHYDTRA